MKRILPALAFLIVTSSSLPALAQAATKDHESSVFRFGFGSRSFASTDDWAPLEEMFGFSMGVDYRNWEAPIALTWDFRFFTGAEEEGPATMDVLMFQTDFGARVLYDGPNVRAGLGFALSIVSCTVDIAVGVLDDTGYGTMFGFTLNGVLEFQIGNGFLFGVEFASTTGDVTIGFSGGELEVDGGGTYGGITFGSRI